MIGCVDRVCYEGGLIECVGNIYEEDIKHTCIDRVHLFIGFIYDKVHVLIGCMY